MKIGFVSMPLSGHLNPMTALARRLQSRGHEIFFIGVLDCGPIVRAAGLNFVSYCEEEFPAGAIDKTYGPVAKLQGLDASHLSISRASVAIAEAAAQHLPQALAKTGVEALVLDAIHGFLELVPLKLGIPYAQIWNMLHLDFSGATPACCFGWSHEATPEARARNVEGLKTLVELFAPMISLGVSHAEKAGLSIDWSIPRATASRLAVITQIPKEFDFPTIPWPAQFHYTGPFHDDAGREPIFFPWDMLNEEPLIYASLGTLVNGSSYVFKAILEAVGRFPDVQVVLSTGKNIKSNELGPIPLNTIVVPSAPQIELLKRASLCITHAGLNTALESLGQGVPMVAIPIAFDQPGVAARIAYHGVGEFVDVEEVTADHIAELISKVLKNPSYREKALYFQKVIAETNGLDKAADLLEQAFQKHMAGNPAQKTSSLSLA